MFSQMADNEFIKNFICDDTADVADLPTHDRPGCTAYVIATDSKYMLNHQGQWIKITPDKEEDKVNELLNNEVLSNGEVVATLKDAIQNAKGKVEIKMLNDATLDEVINVPAGAEVVLDLNGHAITSAADINYAGGMITVVHGGSLVINGEGTINANASGLMAALQLTNKNFADDTKVARIEINGGHIIGRDYCVCGNGNPGRGNSEVVINGGVFETISHTGSAIFNPQENSKVIINGGKIVGCATGIEMRSGDLTVNYGQIEALSAPASVSPNGNGTTAVGCAVAICQHTTKKPINVEINGGILRGYHALYQANPQKNDEAAVALVKMNVKDGSFVAVNSTIPVYSENKTGFIHGGRFSHPVEAAYYA